MFGEEADGIDTVFFISNEQLGLFARSLRILLGAFGLRLRAVDGEAFAFISVLSTVGAEEDSATAGVAGANIL